MRGSVKMVVAKDGDQLLGQFEESQVWYPVKGCTYCKWQGLIFEGSQEYDCEECHGSGFVRDFSDCKDDEMPYSRYAHMNERSY